MRSDISGPELALRAIHREPTIGVPSWLLNPMEHSHIDRLAGAEPGSYVRDPVPTYVRFQQAIGTCMLDQFIPENPLSMGAHGYEGAELTATTGAQRTVRDGIEIDSPEAVCEHMERFVFPALQAAAAAFDEAGRAAEIVAAERSVQETLGPDILKVGYGYAWFPGFDYGTYGYGPYFMAYALYPDMIERHFAHQADLALLHNAAVARAITEAGLPPCYRLDHDMADSRGTLTQVQSLDRMWFPHFSRCIGPLLDAGIQLIWHCDGNLMEMVPRLLDCGIEGFQGFQYEDGMDYERICRMRTRSGREPIIVAGSSVTRTLPFGTPDDVRRELAWLVAMGPKEGLFLAASSSIAPGVPWENMVALVEALRWFRTHGRG